MTSWLSSMAFAIFVNCRSDDVTSTVLWRRLLYISTDLNLSTISLLKRTRSMPSSPSSVLEFSLWPSWMTKVVTAFSKKTGIDVILFNTVAWLTFFFLLVRIGSSSSTGCFSNTTCSSKATTVFFQSYGALITSVFSGRLSLRLCTQRYVRIKRSESAIRPRHRWGQGIWARAVHGWLWKTIGWCLKRSAKDMVLTLRWVDLQSRSRQEYRTKMCLCYNFVLGGPSYTSH